MTYKRFLPTARPTGAAALGSQFRGPVGAIFAFKCQKCSKIHEGSPGFGYDAPWHYSGPSEEEKAAAELKSDTCVIRHDEGVDRFIRVVLEIPIQGVDEPFMWGVWVSLSEKSFTRYLETWDEPDESDSYFGWFCNRLPYYEDTISLKVQVRPPASRSRCGLGEVAFDLTWSWRGMVTYWPNTYAKASPSSRRRRLLKG